MDHHDLYTDLEDLEVIPQIRNVPKRELRPPNPIPPKPRLHRERDEAGMIAELVEQNDTLEGFDFTYKASRHERVWIIDSLGPFYEGQWIDDVLRLLKGGKEAHVYQCPVNASVIETHGGELRNRYIAAKVYRPRMFRNLRKDHLYREGRDLLDADGHLVKDDRAHHAVAKRTGFGRRVMHTSWIEHEYKALVSLYAAGADIPVPFERGNNAILMSYVGGEELPAPTLNEVELEPDEALKLYHRTLHNIDLMLSNDLVHGDLSAYNILYWQGEITLIDFPQAIDPHINSNAYSIFARDVQRICDYFSRQGIRCNPRRTAAELWTAHGHRLGPDINPVLLDADDEDDRAYWNRMSGV